MSDDINEIAAKLRETATPPDPQYSPSDECLFSRADIRALLDDWERRGREIAEMNAEREDEQEQVIALQRAEIASLTARVAELTEALEPVVEKFTPALQSYEDIRREFDEPLRSDDERADEIYSWALGVSWGDLRRARAVLAKGEG